MAIPWYYTALSGRPETARVPDRKDREMARFHLGALSLTSTAFEHAGPIPKRHTGEGGDVSPALSWTNVPDGTRSLALVCHDPDAPLTYGWTHGVVYGSP